MNSRPLGVARRLEQFQKIDERLQMVLLGKYLIEVPGGTRKLSLPLEMADFNAAIFLHPVVEPSK